MIHFLFRNGIGQNITAGVLIGVPTAIWARVKVWPRWRSHERRILELHTHIVKREEHHEDPQAV